MLWYTDGEVVATDAYGPGAVIIVILIIIVMVATAFLIVITVLAL